ncbi:MAG: hypothetical protein CVU30_07580 [Betaproteobacteria bacterium HGW-Betaproteobacteria-3]|jgi:hypothetical protein|nr:MAG: hypothetical protein CVU30_07580 [Betaproteobacteria bacterium HGW-Betaproteobacteria-3]
MIHWRELPAWLMRAWPFWALLPAFATHWLALTVVPGTPQVVNKIAGMVLQVSGGLLILYSVNDNLGLFRRQSLLAAAVTWFKAFPRKGKNITIQLSGVSAAMTSGSASVSIRKTPTTLEERVDYLESTLAKHRQEVAESFANAQSKLEGAKSELHARIDTTVGQIVELSQKVEHAAVGGFKLQGFGVLLAIYGAATSVFA